MVKHGVGSTVVWGCFNTSGSGLFDNFDADAIMSNGLKFTSALCKSEQQLQGTIEQLLNTRSSQNDYQRLL